MTVAYAKFDVRVAYAEQELLRNLAIVCFLFVVTAPIGVWLLIGPWSKTRKKYRSLRQQFVAVAKAARS